MVLTDRQAADRRASNAVAAAHQAIAQATQANGGNMPLAFRNGLRDAARELHGRLIEIYAELEDAGENAVRVELIESITTQITAFIESSAKTQRGMNVGAAARESAKLIASYGAGVANAFELAVHAATKKRTVFATERPVPPAPLHARTTQDVDLLLVVTTDEEHSAIVEAWKTVTKTDQEPAPIHGNRRSYDDLGFISGARVGIVQTQMGSTTVGGSSTTINIAIEELQPNTIIMVGIAFGVDPSKQPIGTVLVSEKVHPYEVQRIGTSPDGKEVRINRGDKATASPDVLSRLKNANRKNPAQFGLLLSGEKLIDNHDYREQLRKQEPEAIGGEMEGAGLYVAATEHRRAWCIVKAVCDWADGNKGTDKRARQQVAAKNAAEYVMRAIALGGFAAKAPKGTPEVPNERAKAPASESLLDRLDVIRRERVARFEASDLASSRGAGIMLFHVVPSASLERATRIEPSTLKKLPMAMISLDGGGNPRINVDGYLLPITDGEGMDVGYVQAFRSGVIESVMSPLADGNPPRIASIWFEKTLINSVRATLSGLQAIDLTPPYCVGITLVRVRNVRFAVSNTRSTERIDRDVLFLPSVEFDQAVLSFQQVATALRPAFDIAWQAAGAERSYNFNEAGDWNGR